MSTLITPEEETPELRAATAARKEAETIVEAAAVAFVEASAEDKKAALDAFMRAFGEWLACSQTADDHRKAILLEKLRKQDLIVDFFESEIVRRIEAIAQTADGNPSSSTGPGPVLH